MEIALVEDQQQDAKLFCEYCDRFAQETGTELTVTVFDNGLNFLANYVVGRYSIIFLDIDMPVLNGMDAARKLREKDKSVIIVFVTNLASYAIDGYQVQAFDFVLKPLVYFDFKIRLKRTLRSLRASEGTRLMLKNAKGTFSVDAAKIVYVEALNNKLVYHVENQVISVAGHMRDAESRLLSEGFFKCHRCYIVNLRNVVSVEDDSVNLGEVRVPLSRLRRKEMLDALTDFLGEGGR